MLAQFKSSFANDCCDHYKTVESIFLELLTINMEKNMATLYETLGEPV